MHLPGLRQQRQAYSSWCKRSRRKPRQRKQGEHWASWGVKSALAYRRGTISAKGVTNYLVILKLLTLTTNNPSTKTLDVSDQPLLFVLPPLGLPGPRPPPLQPSSSWVTSLSAANRVGLDQSSPPLPGAGLPWNTRHRCRHPFARSRCPRALPWRWRWRRRWRWS